MAASLPRGAGVGAIAHRSLRQRPGRWGGGSSKVWVGVLKGRRRGLGPGGHPAASRALPAESCARPRASAAQPREPAGRARGPRRDVLSPPSPSEREEPSLVANSEIKANASFAAAGGVRADYFHVSLVFTQM